MTIVDVGTGPPIVMIPGIQGRWEWMAPAVESVARRCRVITFSLADEPSAKDHNDRRPGVDGYVDQVEEALAARGVQTAAVCGVSYGGLVAAAFASRHPERTASLLLVSALPPDWKPDARVSFYLRAPRLLSPLFCAASLRLHREIAAATPGRWNGWTASARHGWNAATHPFSPTRMAHRVRHLARLDLNIEIGRLDRPVLIVTGEPALDRVVPVDRTREYATIWPHARIATLERTGHLGLITRPEAFADLVGSFVHETAGSSEPRRHIG